jgi:hypothetical protein
MKTSFVMLSRGVSLIGGVLFSISAALAQAPLPGLNVNMVTGTKWPAGDAFLTKQNEASIAVSSLNSQHLLAGANDYRLVDPFFTGDSDGGDAWVTVYKSVDGGVTWRTSLIPGCPLNITACNNPASPVKGLQFAADPTVRAGPYGTFFYSFIAANRNTATGSVTVIQRFIDQNNNIKPIKLKSAPSFTTEYDNDPFISDYINVIDRGTTGQLLDKSWHVADMPGRKWNTGSCIIPGYNKNANGIEQPVPAFNVYISYSNFVGQANTNPHPQILVARSTDCGQTFGNPVKVSQSIQTNQGSTMAIDPVTGALYVFWRVVGDPSVGTSDAIYMNVSSDGGNKWGNPTLVTNIIPFDQPTSGASFRTLSFPAAAVSVDSSGVSRVHVVWAQRKGSATADARIAMATARIDASSGSLSSAWMGGASSFIDEWSTDPNNAANLNHPENYNPANPGRGHQFQPGLTFSGGKLMAIWFDQRLDQTIGYMDCSAAPPVHSLLDCVERRRPVANLALGQVGTVFWQYLADVTPTGQPALTRRHTIDVFAAMAAPADAPAFTSNRISQYLFGNKKLATKGSTEVQQMRFNAPNVPIFANSTVPFMGDYLDVNAQTITATGKPVPPIGSTDPTGHSQAFNFNCGFFPSVASTPPFCGTNGANAVFHAAWTDNRDVVPPRDGNWQNHTPISKFVAADGSAGTQLNSACTPRQDGSRNQNIYTALITQNAAGFANVNSKKLNATTPRNFVVGVENLDELYRSYVLTIPSQPQGGVATFVKNANPPVTTIDVTVPPRSSTSRSVWVTSSAPGAGVGVNVCSATNTSVSPFLPATCDQSGAPITQIVLNPDPQATLNLNAASTTTQDIANINLTDVTVKTLDLTNLDLTNQDLANLDITNQDIANQDIANLDIANLDLTNQDIANLDITNLDLTNQDITNLDIANQDITNNDITNQDLTNSAPADATFTVQNTFIADSPDSGSNTDTTVDVKTLLRDQKIPDGYRLQLVLRKMIFNPTSSKVTANNVCAGIGLEQHTAQVANISTPSVVANPDDSQLGNFPVTDPNAVTLPLSPGERAHLTLRILKRTNCTSPTDPTTCDAGDPGGAQAAAFGQTGERFVGISAGGTNTSIPLIVKTFSLLPVVVHKTSTPQPVKSFGGTGSTINWTLVAVEAVNPPSAALPSVTITPANGAATNTATGSTISIVVNKPPAVGTFALTFKVTDQGNPQQSDTQKLILQVISNNP